MSNTHPIPFKLVTKAEAAFAFDVCTRTIDKYIRSGLLPEPVALGAKEYWHPEDFMAHVDRLLGRGRAELTVVARGGFVPKLGAPKDSSATRRQKSRQAAKLSELNKAG